MVARVCGAGGLGVLWRLGEDLAGAVEAGEGLGELRADADDLDDGRDQEGEEHDVGDEAAEGEAVRRRSGARRGT